MGLRKAINQFVEIVRKLTTLQKVGLFAASVGVFSAVVLLVLWANKGNYKPLYTDLSAQDVSDVSSALDGKKIPYRVVDGKTIEVSGEDVYATRIALALEGLPKDQGVGFELFNESKLGMTKFEQDVAYQRAMQGEIARSIATLDEVVEAKVHLSVPAEKLFITDDEDSKASVVVRLRPGKTLRQDQVRAICHLVASAVRGLKPENVQILDTNGNLLSEFMSEEDAPTYATLAQLEQQKQIEKDLEKKVQSLLSRTLGNDNFVARVSVEMDFSKKSIKREEYSDTPVLRFSETYDESRTGTSKTPGGIPGVESNLAEPDYYINDIFEEYALSYEVQDFLVSKVETLEEKRSGEIKRITVSVVVDDKPETTDQDGVKTVVKKPRTDDELKKIKTAVASAVGYNANRGDIVDVINISFDTSADGAGYYGAETSKGTVGKIMVVIGDYKNYITAVIVLIIFFFLLIRPILKRLDTAPDIDEELLGESAVDAQLSTLDITVGDESGFPKTVEDLEREIESELNESVPVDVEAVKSKVMLKKIEEAANDDPEMVANLLKALIKGG